MNRSIKTVTDDSLIEVFFNLLTKGKVEDLNVDFSVVHGQFTEEWQKDFLSTLTGYILENSRCEVLPPLGRPWQPYYVVKRENGTAGCIKMFPFNKHLKGVRWEGRRPEVGIIISKIGSNINIDESIYGSILPCLKVRNHGLIKLELQNAAE
jgi:hypothetical protein